MTDQEQYIEIEKLRQRLLKRGPSEPELMRAAEAIQFLQRKVVSLLIEKEARDE